jgi:hypothetical protein
VVERSVAFLQGKYWPDEGRVDIGVSASDQDDTASGQGSGRAGMSFQGGNVIKPPTKAEIACKYVFDEDPDWTSQEQTIDVKRRQGLFREARLIDVIFIMFRAIRLCGLSMHTLFMSPAMLQAVAISEECLKLAVSNNPRTQIFVAARKYTGRRVIEGYHNGWLAEVMAINNEWGRNAFSNIQRPGRYLVFVF